MRLPRLPLPTPGFLMSALKVRGCSGPARARIIRGRRTQIPRAKVLTSQGTSLIRRVIESIFDEEEVAVFEGGVETSTALLELPFDHI